MRKLALLLIAVAAAGCHSYPEAVKYPAPGWFKPAFDELAADLPVPDFTLNDLDGRPWRLADQRGKVVVLLFASNSDPSYVGALDAFNAEVVARFADNPNVLIVTIYSQESHPELAGGKHNPNVINPGSDAERRLAAHQGEYRLRFVHHGKAYDVSGTRPAAANCVTLIDRINDRGEPAVGRLYGYGRGGTTNTVFLINPRGRLVLKSVWLRNVLSIRDHVHGNLAEQIDRLLSQPIPAPQP